jgi:hypothetical protein
VFKKQTLFMLVVIGFVSIGELGGSQNRCRYIEVDGFFLLMKNPNSSSDSQGCRENSKHIKAREIQEQADKNAKMPAKKSAQEKQKRDAQRNK